MLKDIIGNITSYLFTIPCALIALTFHEFAHGYVAHLLGDHTAKNFGRLSLNPIKHLDLIGTLCMIFFHFGWAKPVPVNSRHFKNPKRDMALTAAAGPTMNFLLGFFALFIIRLIDFLFMKFPPTTAIALNVYTAAALFFTYFHTLNISLGVFNLIPIPPFDGSRILFTFLPPKFYFGIMKYERYIMIGLLVLLWTGIISLPINTVVIWISTGMQHIVNLIP